MNRCDRPEPKFAGGVWTVDLRWAGGGRHRLRAASQLDAIHESYQLLAQLRPQGDAPAPAAHGTRPAPVAAVTFGYACDKFEPEKARARERTEGGKAYVAQYLKAIRAELGHVDVAAFEPPHGTTLLENYRNELADRGFGAKTRRNRVFMVQQILTFCQERGWLLRMPKRPRACVDGERLNDPEYHWITETDFRLLRAELYRGGASCLRGEIRDPAEREHYPHRRRLYLSVGFYTGMHTADLDRLTGEHLAWQLGTFLRSNQKSHRAVPERRFMMPEQLQLDCAAEVKRLGRMWRPDELVCGGEWNKPTTRLIKAGKRLPEPLDVPPTLRVMRRSCAYHLCLLGWSERDVAEYLGHVDQTMIRAVYARVPVELRSPVKLPWTNANMALVTGRLTARAEKFDFGPRKAPHAAPAPLAVLKGGKRDAG